MTAYQFERLFQMSRTVKYNADSVQKAIDRDKTIGSKEAKLIHALLKGWRKE